jgi:hypothetical protein
MGPDRPSHKGKAFAAILGHISLVILFLLILKILLILSKKPLLYGEWRPQNSEH